ncbi:MAG: DsbA family protein [Alphaproteobacteria bacterium]|nr:DsbA family protein [Alphaproteobacteria bacterium]
MPNTTIFRTLANTCSRMSIAGAMALAVALTLALPSLESQAQRKKSPDQVDQAEILKSEALKDIAVGDANAPVTIVEYASLTCGHCATFHTQVYPKLKEKYIDTGKARIIMREFPLNARAYAASMITRCVGDGGSLPLVEGLFETQKDWAFKRTNQEFKQALFDFTKQAGLSEDDFNKCLGNSKLLNDLTAQFTKASEVFGVDATPAFFINGKRLRGGPTLDNFVSVIDPMLAEKQ